MGDHERFVATIAQPQGEPGEFACGFLGQFLPGLARLEGFGIGERALEPIALRAVEQIVEGEDVSLLDRVGPVGVDPDHVHVEYDQQRRIFQRRDILQQLRLRLVEIGVAALVLPLETAALPHVGLAFASARLARTNRGTRESGIFRPETVFLHRSDVVWSAPCRPIALLLPAPRHALIRARRNALRGPVCETAFSSPWTVAHVVHGCGSRRTSAGSVAPNRLQL